MMAFNRTQEFLPELATDPVMNYFAIGIDPITFLTGIGPTITYIRKAQGHLTVGQGQAPPAWRSWATIHEPVSHF